MKICFKCGLSKPIEEYYKHSRMADGHLNKCKDCAKTDVNTHRNKNIEKFREYDRNRFRHNEKRRANHTVASRKYNREHPERKRARAAVRRAFLSGKIVKRSCEACGEEKVEMHHPDYSRPLDIMWLCKVCHEKWHIQFGDS